MGIIIIIPMSIDIIIIIKGITSIIIHGMEIIMGILRIVDILIISLLMVIIIVFVHYVRWIHVITKVNQFNQNPTTKVVGF